MAEIVTSTGQSERPALEPTIAPRRFPPLQFLERAEDANGEDRRTGSLQNVKDIIGPSRLLKEVVDDQVGTEPEMRAPASVNSREQSVAVGIEDQPEARAPPMGSSSAALIDVFPARPAVMGCTGHGARGTEAC